MNSNYTPGYFTGNYKGRLSGGLYTQASALSVPEGYSPALSNVFVNDRLNLQTRYGTQELLSDAALANMCGAFVYTGKSGIKLLVAKVGKSLVVYHVREVADKELFIHAIKTYDNVWSTEATNSRADFTYVADGDTVRIIICTGNNTPIQLRLIETSKFYATEASTQRVPFIQNGYTYPSVGFPTIAVFDDGVFVPAETYGKLAGNDPDEMTFWTLYIGGPLLPRGGELVFISMDWHWYTESVFKYGINVCQDVLRFNLSVTDQAVAIPLELLYGIKTLESDDERLPMVLYKNNSITTPYTYDSTPTGIDEYKFSGGTFRSTVDTAGLILAGVTHTSFGALQTSSNTISTITYTRLIDIKNFDGGFRLTPNDIEVFGNNDAFGGGINTDYKGYNDSSGLSPVLDSLTLIDFVGFDVSRNGKVGIDNLAQELRVVRRKQTASTDGVPFVGTAATDNDDLPYTNVLDGNYWPAYGFAEHCNYYLASFPKISVIHENRLIFAGFPLRPNRIIMSAVADTTVKDEYYTDYQIAEQEGIDSNAVVLDLTDADPEGITALASVAGALFVFTINSTYIVTGGEAGITPLQKSVSKIANVGAMNSNCVTIINDSLVLLSRRGVFRLVQSFDAAGGWRVQSISEPVNDRLRNEANKDYAWMTYLPSLDTLYVGAAYYGNTKADILLLWRQDVNAWSEFTDITGRFGTITGVTLDLASNYLLLTSNNSFISYPYKHPIDQRTVADVSVVPKLPEPSGGIVHTLPFTLIPDLGVDDLGKSSLSVDVQKLNDKQLFVNTEFGAGEYVYPKAVGDYTFVAYRNGVLVLSDFEPGDVKGFVYKCFVTTPTLMATSQDPSSHLNSPKSITFASFMFHTNGDYTNFGVNIKRVDDKTNQKTYTTSFPEYDTKALTTFSAGQLELLDKTYKAVVHVGGVQEPFHQFIVYSDSLYQWELLSYQAEVEQSSKRMRGT